MLLIHNGVYKPINEALLIAGSRGIRFGEGIFETMHLQQGRINFYEWHFERLQLGLSLLELTGIPAETELREQCLALAKKNNLDDARVRLTVTGGPGSLFDKVDAEYVIETFPLVPGATEITTTLYTGLPRNPNMISHIKHNNFLNYIMAARHAKQKGASESIIINTQGNICEGTVSNFFLVKDQTVFTPPLSEGCIAGIYRRYLIETLPSKKIRISERPVTLEDLDSADEVFLTNSIQGIRSVLDHDGKKYGTEFTTSLKNTLGV